MVCNNNNSNSVNNCIIRVQAKCCPLLVYPRNQNGFPFSGNTNTPGSRLSGYRIYAEKIRSRQLVANRVEQSNVNHLGRLPGGLGGSGRAIRNVF